MGDRYDSYAALAAVAAEGADYTRTVRDLPTTSWAAVAIHGGGIEEGSGEVALAVGDGLMATYVFAGIRSRHNSELHVTSVDFDDPQCLAVVGGAENTISFHGYTGPADVAETALGGLDGDLERAVAAALTAGGFAVTSGSREISGTDPRNICNRNRRGAGVQLELSEALRRSFFPGGDLSRRSRESGRRTQRFQDYVQAVRSVVGAP